MSDSGTLLLIIGMFVIVIVLFVLIYRLFLQPELSFPHEAMPAAAAPGEKGPALQETRAAQKSAVQAAADALAAEIQAGTIRIVATTKCLQDQIQLLASLRTTLDPAHPLEEEKALRFQENEKNLDRLADRYIVLYHELRILLENENLIRSPDVLHIHRQQEVEKIRQLTALSKEIQPLLNENEDIVAPCIGYVR